jgi:hypothetical protein
VRLLDHDGDLVDAIPPEEREHARRLALAPLARALPGGALPVVPGRSALGLLVLRGLVVEESRAHDRRTLELLGEGDLLAPVPGPGVTRQVLVPTAVAVLDGAFTARVAPCPAVTVALAGRASARASRLGVQQLLAGLPRVETRLLLVLWQLAERWGKACVEGVWLPLALTQETLAGLVSARRPAVNAGLVGLEREGRLRREPDGVWLFS